MNITVFTSNQPRHIYLLERLSEISDNLYAIIENVTIFPGLNADFYKNSFPMQRYFEFVRAAETDLFGTPRFYPNNCRYLNLRAGDLKNISLKMLEPALSSDLYLTFGCSYIQGELYNHLEKHKAVNIHMGISPYYKGSSCNFWALLDHNPHLVGATIHLLSKQLDAGPILFHALPKTALYNPFELGMTAVNAAINGIVKMIVYKSSEQLVPQIQNSINTIKYSKNQDFTDEIVVSYLENLPDQNFIYQKLIHRDLQLFINPFVDS